MTSTTTPTTLDAAILDVIKRAAMPTRAMRFKAAQDNLKKARDARKECAASIEDAHKMCKAAYLAKAASKDKKPDANGKMQVYPAVFDIDTAVCMSCQICVEVCPFDAIKMDQVFEIAGDCARLDGTNGDDSSSEAAAGNANPSQSSRWT